MWTAIHRSASPADRDRLRRWLDTAQITIEYLQAPDRDVSDEIVAIYCYVTRHEKRSFAKTAFSMGTSESALFRGLLRAALSQGMVNRAVEVVQAAGFDWSVTVPPRRPCQYIYTRIAPHEHRSFVRECKTAELFVGHVLRGIVLDFLSRWGIPPIKAEES